MRTNLKDIMSMRSSRRYVLENIEIKDDKIEEKARRESICIPSKNALLLMQCRSDPMKMASLANRFSWDANAASKQEDAMKVEKILIKRLKILKNNYTYKNVKLQMKWMMKFFNKQFEFSVGIILILGSHPRDPVAGSVIRARVLDTPSSFSIDTLASMCHATSWALCL
ncbi:Uncharacterized protein Fot_18996 [Forsythia ovata]|uniref:Uncharacterized protein n=1 Tax=Forsythia ovata TaxID=205694 RepID=A0ABD1VML8_9LAMI